nr:hypothetical protein [Tanacetum cinerariifolium]
MNQNYFKPNLGYNSNYFGFNQPSQYSINHQEDLNQQRISDVHDRWDKLKESQNELLNMMQSFCEWECEIKIDELGENFNGSTIPLNKIISQIPPSIVITSSPPILPIEDSEDSLIMENEELSTILEKESDEFIKSSVEDLFQSQVSPRIHLGVI